MSTSTGRKCIIVALSLVAFVVAGCGSAADTVNRNLGKAAENFEIQRKIVGINGITDKVLFEVEGRCSLEQNNNLPANLEIICKTGPGAYSKHFVGLSDNVTWISTQLHDINVNEYRTRFIFRPQSVVPDIDLITGTQP